MSGNPSSFHSQELAEMYLISLTCLSSTNLKQRKGEKVYLFPSWVWVWGDAKKFDSFLWGVRECGGAQSERKRPKSEWAFQADEVTSRWWVSLFLFYLYSSLLRWICSIWRLLFSSRVWLLKKNALTCTWNPLANSVSPLFSRYSTMEHGD